MKALVSIIMGSDSDLEVMKKAADVLKELGIGYELTIASAHRTPDKVHDFAAKARERGVAVIIAGAGMSAALPGVIAAYTTVPVIGVPIKGSSLAGLDALLSIVQMPPGVPVATMAVNGAKNAGVFAAQILAVADAQIAGALDDFRARQACDVEKKADKLAQQEKQH